MAVPVRLPGSRLAMVAGLLALAGLRADEPSKPAAKAPPAGRSIDPAKLPPNTVIIVSDNPRDALQNVDAVVLSPDEYKKLLDAAEQARRLAAPDQPQPPTVCRLRGKVESRGATEAAVLRAEYQFRTTSPRATVLLGLQKGKPVAATIDGGKLAVLVPVPGDDGFAVHADAPGEHTLVVDLEVPLVSRGSKGGERGVELGLPGAAITAIERLDLPAGVTKIRLGGRAVTARQLASGTDNAPAALLGPTQKLELTWDVPSARGEPLVSVDGRYDVRVDDRSVTTRARLAVKVQGGPVARWEVHAPPTAEVTAEAAAADTPPRIDKPRDKSKPWVIRRDPTTDDLVVDVTVRTVYEAGRSVGVPVFGVVGAAQQRGTITVGAPPHLRLTYQPAADVTRRESPDDGGHDAVFAYHRLPNGGSPLGIEVQPARGAVETQVAHQLSLTERGWRWLGKVDARPVRTEVTAVDLEVPQGWEELRATSAELVEGIAPARDGNVVRVQLAAARRKPFTITLEAIFPVGPAAGAASLPLPRVLGTLDRGGQLAAAVPAGLDLLGSYREWDGNRPAAWDRPLEPPARGGPGLFAAVERAPARVDLAWRAPRLDVLVTATADVQLADRQATVRHRWHVPAGPAAPRLFVARGPAVLGGRLRVVEGGSVTATAPGEWSVSLTAPASRDAAITLAYSFPLPVGPDRPPVAVPLVWLDACPRCETDVRVWAGATPSGILTPFLAGGPWEEVPPRAAADRGILPALSLHASGPQLPLTLRLAEEGAGPGTGLVIDKVWVQAIVDADGQQAYRTRCLIRPQQTHYLDVELPEPPAAIRFAVFLDGKLLPLTTADGPGGRFVRVRLDPTDSAAGPRQLDLVHVLPPRIAPRWDVTLTPPRLRGPVFVGPVRWQVGLAADDLIVNPDESAAFDWRWGWDRALFVPRPAWTGADLRRWFGPGPRPVERADPADGLEASMVGWQPTLEPLTIVAVPRPLALLIGSLVVLLVGLAAVRAPAGARAAGAIVVAVGATVLTVIRPQVLPALLYAIQPGILVLAVILLARWVARRRYQRRVLFLPGFTRPAAGTRRRTRPPAPEAAALPVRNGATASGVRREPSTIDAPAAGPGRPAGEW